MGGFMWLLLCVTFLQLTEIHGGDVNVFVRNEDEVTLPCRKGTSGQRGCERTTWMFRARRNSSAREIISHGNVQESVESQSQGLTMTADCSLLINKVTSEHVGHYYCKQSNQSNEDDDEDDEDGFLLFLVNLSERTDSPVQFTCSVWAQTKCEHTLKLLYEGEDVHGSTKVSELSYICLVSWTVAHKPVTPELLECEVTEADGEQVHRFPFRSAGQKTDGDQIEPTRAASAPAASGGGFDWIWFIIVCVGLTGLSLTAWLLPWWMNSKRNTSQSSGTEMGMCVRVVEASAASADPHVVYENQQNT